MERLSYIIKNFLYFLLSKYPSLTLILSISLLCISLYVIKTIYDFKLRLEDLKMDFDKKFFILIIPFFLSIYGLLILYRSRNIGKSVDFKEICLKLKNFMITTPYLHIFLTLLLFIIFTLNLIFFFLLIKKLTLIIFCKINFFIINNIPKNIKREKHIYSRIKDTYSSFFLYIVSRPFLLFELIFGQNYSKTSQLISKLAPFYATFILAFVFFFEIFFNKFALYYFFFIIPLVFIYSLAYSIYNCCNLVYDTEEDIICHLLYDENLLLVNEEIYIGSFGYRFPISYEEEIKFFIEQKFDRTLHYYNFIKKFGRKPELS